MLIAALTSTQRGAAAGDSGSLPMTVSQFRCQVLGRRFIYISAMHLHAGHEFRQGFTGERATLVCISLLLHNGRTCRSPNRVCFATQWQIYSSSLALRSWCSLTRTVNEQALVCSSPSWNRSVVASVIGTSLAQPFTGHSELTSLCDEEETSLFARRVSENK
jgi:hypothetical protein